MRILVVNHRDWLNPRAGGLEEVVAQTCRRWVQWGHEVTLLCAGFAGAPRETQIDGVHIRRGPNEYVFNWWAPLHVWSLGASRFDIILEYISKVPCFIPTFVHHAPTAVMVPHLFGKAAFDELPWPLAAYTYGLEQPIGRVYRQCDFWALSNTTATDLISRGIEQKRITVIYPGFNDALLRPLPNVTKTPAPSLIYVGRLKKYKRIDLIIAALHKLTPQFPGIHLFIVGTGDYEAELRRQVAALRVERAVEFCGFVSEERKQELLQTGWLGVQTSTIEGWGLGVIEAGACGTPTVASHSPGLCESVRDGETGVLVPHGNLETLTEQIARLLTDNALRAKYGVAAKEWAKSLSWEEMSRRALQFLEQAAGKKRKHV